VFSRVPCQFVRPSKSPPATFKVAHVRLLARVCSLVSLEVAGFGVRLVAARLRTGVDDLLPLRPRPPFPRFPGFRQRRRLGCLQRFLQGLGRFRRAVERRIEAAEGCHLRVVVVVDHGVAGTRQLVRRRWRGQYLRRRKLLLLLLLLEHALVVGLALVVLVNLGVLVVVG